MSNYLKAYIQKEQQRWCEYIDFALFSYNNSYNSRTGFSPFELLYGKICKLPSEITNRTAPVYNYENYAHELRQKLKSYHDLARENLIRSKEWNKKYYDQHQDKTTTNLNKNDLVLILKSTKKHKYEQPYEGPYRVEKVLSPVTIIVRRGTKSVKIHIDRLKLVWADYGKNTPPLIE